MWIKFTQPFDFSPAVRKGMVTIAYKAGMRRNVTQECADKAIAAGKAHRTVAPRKEASNGEEAGRR